MKNAPKSVGPCPGCGKPTEGQHIAGSIYDYQCDPCVDEADADFRSFIDALIEDRLPDLPEEDRRDRD